MIIFVFKPGIKIKIIITLMNQNKKMAKIIIIIIYWFLQTEKRMQLNTIVFLQH